VTALAIFVQPRRGYALALVVTFEPPVRRHRSNLRASSLDAAGVAALAAMFAALPTKDS
jgi:hypothetical protein